ncbi:hypothetical protein ACIQPR_21570 [Streptomyces sp. NPDC091280]|uniref:hypothetical protein n=1 Tax=Streptomyces sp. NPDC091280 TaxID=3365984 RepID=UPI0037FAA2A7
MPLPSSSSPAFPPARRRRRRALLVGSGLLTAAAVFTGIQTGAFTDGPAGSGRQQGTVAAESKASRPPATTAPGPSVTAAPTSPSAAPPSPNTPQSKPSSDHTGRTDGTDRTDSTDTGTTATGRAGTNAATAALNGTQLAPSALPDYDEMRWRPISDAVTQPLDQDFGLNECVSVPGALVWQQQGFISARQTPAVQDTLSFPDEASARAAYRGVVDAMKGCAAKSRALQKQYGLAQDAEVRRTAAVADPTDGTSWMRSWNGVQGFSAPGDQTNHVYAVRHGRVLALLHFDEWAAKAAPSYDPRGDAAVLCTLGAQLAG